MTYEEFKAAVPHSVVTESEFPFLKAQAEAALQDLLVYDAGNLKGGALASYRSAWPSRWTTRPLTEPVRAK